MSDQSSEPLDSSLRQAVVPDSAAGRRFDAVLAELFPEFSRSRLSEWIKSGDALLDGETARPRDTLRGGETVQVQVVLETQTHAAPQDIPLNVLYEDDQVLVIDKPAGLVVHPGAGNPDGTLVNALLFRDPNLAAVPRAGVVHRLDKDTSGVMVVARTLQAQTALVEQLSARDVHRQYLAVVVGRWSPAAQPMRRSTGTRATGSRWRCATTAATPSPITVCASASARTPRWNAAWKPGVPIRSACTWRT